MRDLGWHVVKRGRVSPLEAAWVRLAAVFAALVAASGFIAFMGVNPLEVYAGWVKGALGSEIALRESIRRAIPLCVIGLGISLAFRMRFWNIGAEGQVCVGATAATYFALFHADWPPVVLISMMAIAAIVAGGLWGMIPAYFKARFGTNETLFTLMMNYIAVYVIQFLREGPWKNPQGMGYPKIAMFANSAILPKIFGVHAGWIVALILIALVWIYVSHTKQGYEIAVVGGNENTALYAGMNVKKIILRTMFISAGVCGLAGMLQISGADRTLTESVSGGAGFTAIIVAWLAALNPIGIAIVAFLFGAMQKGSGYIQSVFNISTAAAEVVQGTLLFFVLGSEFFLNYSVKRRERGGRA